MTVDSHAAMRSGGSSVTCSISTAIARARVELSVVLVRHVVGVRVGHQHLDRVGPDVVELRIGAERRQRDALFGQQQRGVALFVGRDQRVEGLGQPAGGAAVAGHVLGDEGGQPIIGESGAQLAADVDAVLDAAPSAFGAVRPSREQRQHQVGRQPRRAASRRCSSPRRSRPGACWTRVVGEALQQPQDRFLLASTDWPWARARSCSRTRNSPSRSASLAISSSEARARSSRALRCRRPGSRSIRSSQVRIGRLTRVAFAQNLGVVDLPDLERAAADRLPGTGDAALDADLFGRGGEQRQQHVPAAGGERALQRQLADFVLVEQHRELVDGGLRASASTDRRPAASRA